MIETSQPQLLKLVEYAVKNAKCHHRTSSRWVAVRDLFGVGSTTATELCYHFGVNPHEQVGEMCAYETD
jgi:ribosomal protein S13